MSAAVVAVVVLEAVLLAGCLALLLPVLVLAAELVLALLALGGSRGAPAPGGPRPAVAVLVPAHNEAAVLAATLRSLRAQLLGADRLLVIADNCEDETAAVAAREGAQVLCRADRQRRGKGFALDFAVQHLAADPPALVIVIDADCSVAPGAIELLARACAQADRPIQGLYQMGLPDGAVSPLRRLARFAWTVRNEVRPSGLRRLGWPCQLMGSGMAFPWDTIAHGAFATGHLVEDLKLGLELAAAGRAPLFCPQARVSSTFPATGEGVRTQRRRWEHGHLGLLLGTAPPLLAQALRTRNVPLLVLALDLLVPPLALLALLLIGAWSGGLALYLAAGRLAALVVASALCALLGGSILLAWIGYGRQILPARTLALSAVYLLCKVPLYIGFVVTRQVEWVRSARDPADKRPRGR